MKKLIPLLLAGSMLLGVAACGGGGGSASTPAPSGAPEASAPVSEASDVKIGILIPRLSHRRRLLSAGR